MTADKQGAQGAASIRQAAGAGWQHTDRGAGCHQTGRGREVAADRKGGAGWQQTERQGARGAIRKLVRIS